MTQPTFAQPQTPSFTFWKNPTAKPVKVDLHVGQGGEAPGAVLKYRFEWQPGEVKQIDSQFDRGIQDVRDGVIMGGLAPQLERVVDAGEEAPELHPSLDVEGQKEREALEQAGQALAAKKASEEALVVAAAKVQAATDAKAAKAEAKAESKKG